MKIPHLVALALLLAGSLASLGALCNGGEGGGPFYSPFAGTSWTLAAMGDGDSLRMVAAAPPVTLEFPDVHARERAELTGDTGCNAYAGAWIVASESESVPVAMSPGLADVSLVDYDGGGLAVRMVDFEITERGCPTPDLFEREAMYRDTLATARSAMLVGPRLIIEGATGGVLVLDRVH